MGPHVSNVQAWLIQLGKNLVEASARSDAAEIGWINECKVKEFEELADSGPHRFHKLDLKLSANLMEMIRGSNEAVTFLNDLAIMDEMTHAANGMLKGRTDCAADLGALPDRSQPRQPLANR